MLLGAGGLTLRVHLISIAHSQLGTRTFQPALGECLEHAVPEGIPSANASPTRQQWGPFPRSSHSKMVPEVSRIRERKTFEARESHWPGATED